jgi:iron complex outermembrane recepter protein
VNKNLTSGRTHGAEIQIGWSPVAQWHLTANYTHLDMSLTPSGADNNRGEWLEGSTPRSMAGLRSWLALGKRLEIDTQYRYQSRIRTMPVVVTGEGVDAYSELDLRVGWRASDHWEFALLGRNLLHDEHVEFGPPASRGALERSIYLKASWHD